MRARDPNARLFFFEILIFLWQMKREEERCEHETKIERLRGQLNEAHEASLLSSKRIFFFLLDSSPRHMKRLSSPLSVKNLNKKNKKLEKDYAETLPRHMKSFKPTR